MPQLGQKDLREPSVAISPGPLCADIAAACCWLRCRKVLAETWKLRLQLWETGEISELIGRVLGQQHSGLLRKRKRTMEPQTDEQRGKRACALTARGPISKAMKGLVGGAAPGSADCRKNWTTALIPRSSGLGTHLTNAERSEAACGAWRSGRYKAVRSAMREQGRSKTGVASLPHVKPGAHQCNRLHR